MADPTQGRLLYLLMQGAKNAKMELSRASAEKLATSIRAVMAEEKIYLIYQSTFDQEVKKLEQTL